MFELKDIEIQELSSYEVDKSLINTRNDIFRNIPTYKEMIFEMHEWIKINNPK